MKRLPLILAGVVAICLFVLSLPFLAILYILGCDDVFKKYGRALTSITFNKLTYEKRNYVSKGISKF
jgi:hypothetical protein